MIFRFFSGSIFIDGESVGSARKSTNTSASDSIAFAKVFTITTASLAFGSSISASAWTSASDWPGANTANRAAAHPGRVRTNTRKHAAQNLGRWLMRRTLGGQALRVKQRGSEGDKRRCLRERSRPFEHKLRRPCERHGLPVLPVHLEADRKRLAPTHA